MKVKLFYLRQHPVTDDLAVADIELTWHEVSEDWSLPADQPTLPHAIAGFYGSEEEARTALRTGEWKEEMEDEKTFSSGRGDDFKWTKMNIE